MSTFDINNHRVEHGAEFVFTNTPETNKWRVQEINLHRHEVTYYKVDDTYKSTITIGRFRRLVNEGIIKLTHYWPIIPGLAFVLPTGERITRGLQFYSNQVHYEVTQVSHKHQELHIREVGSKRGRKVHLEDFLQSFTDGVCLTMSQWGDELQKLHTGPVDETASTALLSGPERSFQVDGLTHHIGDMFTVKDMGGLPVKLAEIDETGYMYKFNDMQGRHVVSYFRIDTIAAAIRKGLLIPFKAMTSYVGCIIRSKSSGLHYNIEIDHDGVISGTGRRGANLTVRREVFVKGLTDGDYTYMGRIPESDVAAPSTEAAAVEPVLEPLKISDVRVGLRFTNSQQNQRLVLTVFDFQITDTGNTILMEYTDQQGVERTTFYYQTAMRAMIKKGHLFKAPPVPEKNLELYQIPDPKIGERYFDKPKSTYFVVTFLEGHRIEFTYEDENRHNAPGIKYETDIVNFKIRVRNGDYHLASSQASPISDNSPLLPPTKGLKFYDVKEDMVYVVESLFSDGSVDVWDKNQCRWKYNASEFRELVITKQLIPVKDRNADANAVGEDGFLLSSTLTDEQKKIYHPFYTMMLYHTKRKVSMMVLKVETSEITLKSEMNGERIHYTMDSYWRRIKDGTIISDEAARNLPPDLPEVPEGPYMQVIQDQPKGVKVEISAVRDDRVILVLSSGGEVIGCLLKAGDSYSLSMRHWQKDDHLTFATRERALQNIIERGFTPVVTKH